MFPQYLLFIVNQQDHVDDRSEYIASVSSMLPIESNSNVSVLKHKTFYMMIDLLSGKKLSKLVSSWILSDIPNRRKYSIGLLPIVSPPIFQILSVRELSASGSGQMRDKLSTPILLILLRMQKEGWRRKWRVGEVNSLFRRARIKQGFSGAYSV